MLMKPHFAILAGVLSFIAGLATGMLLAPAAGEKTRRRLLRRGERLAGEVKDSASDLADRARRRIA